MKKYLSLYLLGRLANGYESDKGHIVHIVPIPGNWTALCGVKPGPHSAGWNDGSQEKPSCVKCIKKFYDKENENNDQSN